MKRIVGILGAVFAVLLLAFGAASMTESSTADSSLSEGAVSDDEAGAMEAESLILVELFTSQGCSSCPPADRLIRRLAQDPEWAGRIAPLSFHVDYWNRLGWTDPYSKAEWSRRQRDYALAMDLDTVYTPQVVINGQAEGVGSKEQEVRSFLREALDRPAVGTLERQGEQVVLRLIDPLDGKAALWVAEVESGLVTEVERGENADRTLHNDFVVRDLKRLLTLPAGRLQASAALPAVNKPNHETVVFLQDEESRAVWLTSRL